MRRFFENKLDCAAVVGLFAFAIAWNLSHDAGAPSPGPLLFMADPVSIIYSFSARLYGQRSAEAYAVP